MLMPGYHLGQSVRFHQWWLLGKRNHRQVSVSCGIGNRGQCVFPGQYQFGHACATCYKFHTAQDSFYVIQLGCRPLIGWISQVISHLQVYLNRMERQNGCTLVCVFCFSDYS